MAKYFVGDIQGCFSELTCLLEQVEFDPKKDTLYPVGDLVARGTESLETLRFLKGLGKSCKPVLGNHDLHLLAIVHGIRQAKPSDKLDKLLAAKDKIDCVEWLAQQPLIRHLPKSKIVMVHAGLAPSLSLEKSLKHSQKVEKRLKSEQQFSLLKDMYGDLPNYWHSSLTDLEKRRFIINASTRMRFCYLDGSLEFNCKGSPSTNDKDIVPWFSLHPALKDTKIVFGHWASLMGKTSNSNAIALDTGCVWGNHMTCWQSNNNAYFHQPSLRKL